MTATIGYRVKWGTEGRNPETIGYTTGIDLTEEEAHRSEAQVRRHCEEHGFDWWIAFERYSIEHVGTELRPAIETVCPDCGSEDPECSRCGRGALP